MCIADIDDVRKGIKSLLERIPEAHEWTTGEEPSKTDLRSAKLHYERRKKKPKDFYDTCHWHINDLHRALMDTELDKVVEELSTV